MTWNGGGGARGFRSINQSIDPSSFLSSLETTSIPPPSSRAAIILIADIKKHDYHQCFNHCLPLQSGGR